MRYFHHEEEPMLLDVRTYTCRPGTIKKHLALYEKLGKGPQTRHLGQPFAYLITETGNVNQFIHIWAYEDAADRARKRAAMQADPEWIAYIEESAKLGALDQQQNQLMMPVSFFPLKR
jgi:NIPSNAP protein